MLMRSRSALALWSLVTLDGAAFALDLQFVKAGTQAQQLIQPEGICREMA